MLIQIDTNSPIPIYLQVINQVKNLTAAGLITAGDKMPSVRELSRQLAINPNTIARAYQVLEREGIIKTQKGVGTFIHDDSLRVSEEERLRRINALLSQLLTEAYHLKYNKDELRDIFNKGLEEWTPGRGEE